MITAKIYFTPPWSDRSAKGKFPLLLQGLSGPHIHKAILSMVYNRAPEESLKIDAQNVFDVIHCLNRNIHYKCIQ